MASNTLSCPCYVLADNGFWYRDPVIRGSANSYLFELSWSYPDGAVLAIFFPAHWQPGNPLILARSCLVFSNLAGNVLTNDVFLDIDDCGDGVFRFSIEIFNPPPARLLSGKPLWQPAGPEHDAYLFSFGKDWG